MTQWLPLAMGVPFHVGSPIYKKGSFQKKIFYYNTVHTTIDPTPSTFTSPWVIPPVPPHANHVATPFAAHRFRFRLPVRPVCATLFRPAGKRGQIADKKKPAEAGLWNGAVERLKRA